METKEEVLRTFGAMQSGLPDEDKRRIIGKAYDLFVQLRAFNDEIRHISEGSGLSLHGIGATDESAIISASDGVCYLDLNPLRHIKNQPDEGTASDEFIICSLEE